MHPELRVYRGQDRAHQAKPSVIKFEGDHVSLITVTLVPQPGRAPTLTALTQPAGQPDSIELSVLRGLRLNTETLTIAETTRGLPHGLLATQDAL